MSVRLLLTVGLTALLLGGCRRDPHMQLYIDNVNAEKRLLEDTLYDLQYDYERNLQEVERLRNELATLKSDGETGETSRPAPGSGRKLNAPSRPGRSVIPSDADLTPPTVESGTPEPPNPPAKEPPRKLENMNDLEPPSLDLGEKENGVSTAPQPADPKAAPPGKLASRWTPRAEQPADQPARRVDVAESPGEQASGAGASGGADSTDRASSAAGPSPSGAGSEPKQAQRPQWRPYR